MWTWLHKLGSPPRFYALAERLAPYFGWLALVCIVLATAYGLLLAPVEEDQGQVYRIIYIHVAAAWMSLFAYVFMAVNAAIGLIWRLKVSSIMADAAAPIGAVFTALALITGSIWGEPTWGTWWTSDPRLMSELLLLFLYLGYIALGYAIENPRQAANATAILAVVGVVNVPIIHYSVIWWNSLHQLPIPLLDTQGTIAGPLIAMVVGFQLFFAYFMLRLAQVRLLRREIQSNWVKELLAAGKRQVGSKQQAASNP